MKTEIEQRLAQALQKIGDICPYYDRHVRAWIFRHPDYPVECSGDKREEVIRDYPLYLRDFIEEWLNGNLAPHVEAEIRSR